MVVQDRPQKKKIFSWLRSSRLGISLIRFDSIWFLLIPFDSCWFLLISFNTFLIIILKITIFLKYMILMLKKSLIFFDSCLIPFDFCWFLLIRIKEIPSLGGFWVISYRLSHKRATSAYPRGRNGATPYTILQNSEDNSPCNQRTKITVPRVFRRYPLRIFAEFPGIPILIRRIPW